MTTTQIDQIIARARTLETGARAEFLRHHSVAELAELHAVLLGAAKPKTPRPVLERKILAALAEPVATAPAPESTPLDEALQESPVAGANLASWDQALPGPGYVPPAGAGDNDAHDGAGAAAAPIGTTGDAGEPTIEPGANGEALAAPERDPRLPPVGTVIIKRDRHGAERARCTIVEGGVLYGETTFRSISAAAVAAARALGLEVKTLNGFAWWGLSSPPAAAGKRRSLDGLQVAWKRYLERATAAGRGADDEERAALYAALHAHTAALRELTTPATTPGG